MYFSVGLGSVRLTIGLEDPEGLLQPKHFYDSMNMYSNYKDVVFILLMKFCEVPLLGNLSFMNMTSLTKLCTCTFQFAISNHLNTL